MRVLSSRATDHPRIRGEHSARGFPYAFCLGSSPHTRGAPSEALNSHSLYRIIPAYAGSTGARWMPSLDQPGSSPHTRGAPSIGSVTGWACRIIPAYAGSTRITGPGWRSSRDHPRIRGEHSDLAASKSTPRGSSPHTRGAPAEAPGEDRLRGIIPAYAGSTPPAQTLLAMTADHPRIRGEHDRPQDRTAGEVGSSPHTRGAQVRAHGPDPACRIIPAYAGSTWA